MTNNILKFIAFGLLLFASGCSDSVDITNLPKPQKQFCDVVSKYRNIYRTIEDKDKYIDQKNDLTAIFEQRKNALKKILKDGRVEQWSGVIDDMSISGSGVYITVNLPCDAHMATNDSLVISTKSPVYQSLRAYSENSKIIFSGNFLVQSDTDTGNQYKSYYSVDNFTDHTSMMNPGFHFRYTQFH